MKFSIEELIKHQEDMLRIGEEHYKIELPIMENDYWQTDITKDTIEMLNITRKHFGNLKSENYIVSMNASDYNQFLEFKKFQIFKKKMDEQNEILMQNNNPVKG